MQAVFEVVKYSKTLLFSVNLTHKVIRLKGQSPVADILFAASSACEN